MYSNPVHVGSIALDDIRAVLEAGQLYGNLKLDLPRPSRTTAVLMEPFHVHAVTVQPTVTCFCMK